MWVWWVGRDPSMSHEHRMLVERNQSSGLAVSVISCWEVAKKVQVGKLLLDRDVAEWIDLALAYPNVELVGLTPEIVVESTRLPEPFHRDPADQLIVATSRVLRIPVLTADSKLIGYHHVEKLQAP
jgi:PIN domain nuclease of toxin-antitoxin system